MTESNQTTYKLIGKEFIHDVKKVYPPFYASRSDELWSNPYLEEIRGKKRNSSSKGLLQLLDVGTGSGITAIHWLMLMPGEIEKVHLTDYSGYAIECARENIEKFCGEKPWNEEKSKYQDQYFGSINGIEIFIKRTKDGEVWPTSEVQYDYIVFNGPHLNKDRVELFKELRNKAKAARASQKSVNKLTITRGLIDGICDPGLKANVNFIQHLKQHLNPEGYALLTFSDYSTKDVKDQKDDKDPLERLLAIVRDCSLVATFLSVSEFYPGNKLSFLNDIEGVSKRKIMLWKNIILRAVDPADSKDTSDLKKNKFNLHKTASGFLAAASQIADIYCTKEPVTQELYQEMTKRMQAFYRMFCEQVGWAKGIEEDFILSGFSLPNVPETKSWIYGRKVYSKIKDYEHQITDYENRIKVPSEVQTSVSFSPSERPTKNLDDTNIHRLEIKDSENGSQGFIDKNVAMDAADSQRSMGANLMGATEEPTLQERYRILLPQGANKYYKEKWDEFFKDIKGQKNDLLQKILETIVRNFVTPHPLAEGEGKKNLSYFLSSRYSGPARKSAVFYLLSSTEDLPFLPSLRSFGRIANTAANNMLTSLNAYEAAKKAARAAVFARNFSHITGSHVISNPEFRHSLAGEDLIRSFKRTLDESCNHYIAAENDLFRFILDNPFRTKELGSNVTRALTEARDKLGTGDVLLENTRRFHEYLQGRFDFIARAIDDTKDQPEPVWFVKDLLEGFLSQTAYLDNVVADVGLRRENMQFFVEIEDKPIGENHKPSTVTFVAMWKPISRLGTLSSPSDQEYLPLEVVWAEHSDNSIENGNSLHTIESFDVMVGLPGGMVAAHAFYSLLENIIRNSAKYGRRNQQKQEAGNTYNLTIQLKRAIFHAGDSTESNQSHYRICIRDNYSLALDSRTEDRDKQPWYLLQKKLEKSFVKDNGEPQTEDLGMMEMQACAQLLCKPAENGYPGDRDPHVSEHEPKSSNSFNLWTTYHANQSDEDTPLSYNLTLNMPILLGCLTGQKGPDRSGLLFSSPKLENLLSHPPFVMVIDGEWLKNNHKLPNQISECRESLPYRILVINNVPSVESQASHDSPPQELESLRGVQYCKDCALYEEIFLAKNDNENDEMETILSAYRAWLLAWKPPPDDEQWHLWLGLEREERQVKEAWGHANNYFTKDDKLVRLIVKAYSTGKSVFAIDSFRQFYTGYLDEQDQSQINLSLKDYWETERKGNGKPKKALLFDNHGNCFPEAYGVEKEASLENSTRFYQKLSGTVSPDLFRMLSRPPKDKFGFCFFIYSLVEACLANVVVVDERMAWSLVEGRGGDRANDRFAEDLLEHQKAGIFPVFRFRQEEADSDVGYYTLVHKERLVKSMTIAQNGHGHQFSQVLKSEGITFVKPDASTRIRANPKPSQSRLLIITVAKSEGSVITFKSGEIKPDVILIHEGAMDILTSQQRVEWEDVTHKEHQEQLQALYQLAPVVRTSGRGRKSRLLGEHLPFIEFGQVSSALLTARNKFSLVRGLLGSVGRMADSGRSMSLDDFA